MSDPTRMQRRRRSGTGRSRPESSATPLAPPRDAGLTVGEGATRRRRGLAGAWIAPALATVALFLLAGLALAKVAPGRPATGTGPAAFAVAAVRSMLPEAMKDPGPAVTPTPFFASFRGVKLRLPVAPQNITVVAFHQASYDDAWPMTSLVAKGSLAEASKAAARKRAARPPSGTAKAGSAATRPAVSPTSAATTLTSARSDGVWTGRALSLWRSGRTGKPNTALDCGARPDTPVFSPVDGTIMEIRAYKLYGKYPDFEIHIKPDAWSDVDVVILHTTDPRIVEGQHVVAGIDQLSKVRALASKMTGLQLAQYTAEGGNHCHVQVNRIMKPNLVWLVGKDPPGMVRRGE